MLNKLWNKNKILNYRVIQSFKLISTTSIRVYELIIFANTCQNLKFKSRRKAFRKLEDLVKLEAFKLP